MFPSLSVTDNVEKQVFPFRRLNLLLCGQAVQLLDKVLGCPLSGVYAGLGILMGQNLAFPHRKPLTIQRFSMRKI